MAGGEKAPTSGMPAVAGPASGPQGLSRRPSMRSSVMATFSMEVFDNEVVPSSLASIAPVLRVASEIEAERPRVAYLCTFFLSRHSIPLSRSNRHGRRNHTEGNKDRRRLFSNAYLWKESDIFDAACVWVCGVLQVASMRSRRPTESIPAPADVAFANSRQPSSSASSG